MRMMRLFLKSHRPLREAWPSIPSCLRLSFEPPMISGTKSYRDPCRQLDKHTCISNIQAQIFPVSPPLIHMKPNGRVWCIVEKLGVSYPECQHLVSVPPSISSRRVPGADESSGRPAGPQDYHPRCPPWDSWPVSYSKTHVYTHVALVSRSRPHTLDTTANSLFYALLFP